MENPLLKFIKLANKMGDVPTISLCSKIFQNNIFVVVAVVVVNVLYSISEALNKSQGINPISHIFRRKTHSVCTTITSNTPI